MDFRYQGKDYPARITMGAHLLYAERTGLDFTLAVQQGKVGGVEIATLLWSAIRSACRADGVVFDVSFEDFCDRVTPEEISEWYAAAQEEALDEAKKKALARAGARTAVTKK